MKQYNSANEYLADVQNEIKWNRAKYAATQELADHITDQTDAYCCEGLSSQDALKRTLRELGDAQTVGAELNRLHRPKTNWWLILMVGLLVLLGISTDFILADISFRRNLLALCIGLSCAAALNFSDYTILIRFPRAIYFLLLTATLLTLFFDVRNGIPPKVYCYSFYLVLLFPIAQIAVILQLEQTQTQTGLPQLVLYLSVPLLIAAILSSLPAMIYLLAADIAFIAHSVGTKRLWVSRSSIRNAFYILLLTLLAFFHINTRTHVIQRFFDSNASFLSEYARHLIADLPFWGNSGMSTAFFYDNPEYALIRLAAHYGSFVFPATLILFFVLVFLSIQIVRNQTARFGQLITCAILVLLCIQFILAFLGNLGQLNGNCCMPFPFIAGGGAFTIFDLLLTGLLLSISRNEDIAKDWLHLVQTHRQKIAMHT